MLQPPVALVVLARKADDSIPAPIVGRRVDGPGINGSGRRRRDLDAFAELTPALPAHGLRLRAVVRPRPRPGGRRRPGSVRGGLARAADPRRPGGVRRLAPGHRAAPRSPDAAARAPRVGAADPRGHGGRGRAGRRSLGRATPAGRRSAGRHRRIAATPPRSRHALLLHDYCTTTPTRTSRPSWGCRSRRSTTGCTRPARSSSGGR